MANRKRNIQMKFYVTEEEKRLIDKKMAQLPTRRYGAYLRKMAIDGYIIYTDTTEIKAFTSELSAIGRNINQIAKRINAGGPAYQADMEAVSYTHLHGNITSYWLPCPCRSSLVCASAKKRRL